MNCIATWFVLHVFYYYYKYIPNWTVCPALALKEAPSQGERDKIEQSRQNNEFHLNNSEL